MATTLLQLLSFLWMGGCGGRTECAILASALALRLPSPSNASSFHTMICFHFLCIESDSTFHTHAHSIH